MSDGILIGGVEYICRAKQHRRIVYHRVDTSTFGHEITPTRIRHDHCEECGCERTFVAKAVVDGPSPEVSDVRE